MRRLCKLHWGEAPDRPSLDDDDADDMDSSDKDTGTALKKTNTEQWNDTSRNPKPHFAPTAETGVGFVQAEAARLTNAEVPTGLPHGPTAPTPHGGSNVDFANMLHQTGPGGSHGTGAHPNGKGGMGPPSGNGRAAGEQYTNAETAAATKSVKISQVAEDRKTATAAVVADPAALAKVAEIQKATQESLIHIPASAVEA